MVFWRVLKQGQSFDSVLMAYAVQEITFCFAME